MCLLLESRRALWTALSIKLQWKWCSPRVCARLYETDSFFLLSAGSSLLGPWDTRLEVLGLLWWRGWCRRSDKPHQRGKKLDGLALEETVGESWEGRKQLTSEIERKRNFSDVVAESLATWWPVVTWKVENILSEFSDFSEKISRQND